MKNLEHFQIPNDGEIPLCEINGLMKAMDYHYANVNSFTNTVELYPKIHITRNLLHPISSGDEGKALFLPVNISYFKRLTQVYYEQGPIEALQTMSSHNHWVIAKTACFLLELLQYTRKIGSLFNSGKMYDRSLNFINDLSQTRNWLHNTIRCISWHPYTAKVAITTCDDNVRIFNNDENIITSLLRCKQQKNITCTAWRPLSNTEIAVGHENGIIVWNVDPNSLVARPSLSNANVLQRMSHQPVISVAWSPKGDKLISVAACDNTILLWDVELNKTNILKRPGGPGNALIKWSSNGETLFNSTNGLTFRIWNCHTWESERWSVLSGRVHAACWSNCGTTLLFATNTESIIYGFAVKSDIIFSTNSKSSDTQAIPLFDVSKVDIDGILVGGLVQCMESDPKGKHLAVLFQETSCITIFNIVHQPGLQLIPSSLVTGLIEETPSTISFVQQFESGACLTIGWSSGRLQYYPIIYTDLINNPDFAQPVRTS